MNTQNKNSPTDKTKNKLYAFVQRDEDDFTCIKLLSEKYDGIIFKYGNVGFGKDENPDGTLPMIFDYDIIKNGCDHKKKAFILANKSRKKYKYGHSKTKKIKILDK